MPDFHPQLNASIKKCCLDWGTGKISLYSRIGKSAKGATVLLPLVLHQLPFDEGAKLLQGVLNQGNAVIMADYKIPERNLDYPAHWLCRLWESFGTHPLAYKDFMRCGGIEGLICRLGVFPQRRGVLWGGGIGLMWICDKGER